MRTPPNLPSWGGTLSLEGRAGEGWTAKGTGIGCRANKRRQIRRNTAGKMKQRMNIQLITAAILSLGGLGLLFCGVCIEPEGEIHESLLIGFGEVATFAGALFGIDYTYKHKYNNENDQTEKRGTGR